MSFQHYYIVSINVSSYIFISQCSRAKRLRFGGLDFHIFGIAVNFNKQNNEKIYVKNKL